MSKELVLEEMSDSSKGLIVVSDINSDPFSTPFDEVVEYAKDNGFSVVRIDAWEDTEELGEMTLEEVHQLIDESRELLDCESLGILGKSFGGQLALTYPDNMSFEFLILWAPAISIGEDNVEKWRSTPLRHAEQATDIKLGKDQLNKIDTRTVLIHGTRDEVVSIKTPKIFVKLYLVVS